MLSRFTALACGLAVAALVMGTSNASQCNRIKAAYYKHPYQYFIINEDVLEIGEQKVQRKFPVSEYGNNHQITAAFAIDVYKEFYLLSPQGAQEGYEDVGIPAMYELNDFTRIQKMFSRVEKGEFRGVDAASLGPNNRVHYFYGCHYIAVDPEDERDITGPKANKDIGLPCDVDAALYSPDMGTVGVIKGDKVWLYSDFSEGFYGPVSLAAFIFELEDYNLCPLTK